MSIIFILYMEVLVIINLKFKGFLKRAERCVSKSLKYQNRCVNIYLIWYRYNIIPVMNIWWISLL